MTQKLKKTGFTLILLLAALSNSIAQSTYTSTNYATIGNVFYLTTANNLSLDYSTTGTNYNWNFATLTGISQNELQFKNPNTTGYPSFPYIYNSRNTNLASTDGTSTTLNIGGKTTGTQDYNDYFKKSDGDLTQVASAYKLNYNGTLIPVSNKFTIPDKIYTFPLKFGNTENSNSEYTVNIPGIYYQSKTLARTNVVDGWGSVRTPFGNFTNVLRMTTNLVENDTIAIGGQGLPRIIKTSRELKWFDTSRKYPVLIVTQSFAANIWTTTKVEYLDSKKDFQTTALFAYNPPLPIAGANVYFQNLSTNATKYNWDFGDPASLTSNTSIQQHPTHIFSTNGIYDVKLTSSNDSFTESTTLKVFVSDTTVPLFVFNPVLPGVGENVSFQNLSVNGTSYVWNFGDPSSGDLNTSTEVNPKHIFNSSGTYLVKLTSSNANSTNSITIPVFVSDAAGALFAYLPSLPNVREVVNFQNLSVNATTYSWNFGDDSSGSLNTSTQKNPTHIFNATGIYTVVLTASNSTSSDTFTLLVNVSDIPVALFAYLPLQPIVGENVNFQNLSVNATSYLWDFDDLSSGSLNTSTDKNPTHIFNTKGTYDVKLTSTNDFTSVSITIPVIVSAIPLGLENHFISDKIKIYPNPFSNYISVSGENTPSEYELINLEGKVFYKGNAIQDKDLSFLSKGIYLLRVTNNNSKTANYKLVKN